MSDYERARWVRSCLLFHRTIDGILSKLTVDQRAVVSMRRDGLPYDGIVKAMKRSDKKWTRSRVRQTCERAEQVIADALLGPQKAVFEIRVSRESNP